MTTRSGGSADDEFWRRPTESDAGESAHAGDTSTGATDAATDAAGDSTTRAAPPYPGPPASTPPPPGWRPPLVVQPPPPRRLPAQDPAAIDAEEQNARALTYGIGMVAAAVLVVVTCLLCGRLLF